MHKKRNPNHGCARLCTDTEDYDSDALACAIRAGWCETGRVFRSHICSEEAANPICPAGRMLLLR